MNSDFEILWRKWTEHSFDSSRWRRMTEGLSRPCKGRSSQVSACWVRQNIISNFPNSLYVT